MGLLTYAIAAFFGGIFLTTNLYYYKHCPKVSTVDHVDIEEFTKHTWYSQMQQETKYQTRESFHCVTATYNLERNRTVPFFDGTVLSVYNYANYDKVNGPPMNTKDGQVLCARQPKPKYPGKLLVGFCYFPNNICGDYWIVGLDKNYEWLIVSGGQPMEKYNDGCTTKLNTTNHSGLWIFSRRPIIRKNDLESALTVLKDKGYTLSQLIPIQQRGCRYEDAFIK